MNQSHDDTFLSRVFGLHSIYNQVNDNYRYYDDTNDLENNFDSIDAPINLSNLRNRDRDRELLDSDSDSDSDSDVDARVVSNTIGHGIGHSYDDGDIGNGEHGNGKSGIYNDTSMGQSNINWDVPKHDIDNKAKAIKFNLPKNDTNPHHKHHTHNQNYTRNHGFFTRNDGKYRHRFQIPPKERALYLWANIVNMDEFLNDIYYYYRNKGINNIVLSKIIDLVILVFLLWFTIFLKWGIDYEKFKNWDVNFNDKITLTDLIVPHYIWKLPLGIKFLLFGFINYIILRSIQLYVDYKFKLKEIQNFYSQLIGIQNDNELMTISWIKIIEKILELKSFNSLTNDKPSNDDQLNTNNKIINDLSSKIRLNPQDIANRIMRKENYFIALINKDILDLSIDFGPIKLSNSSVLTKTLEWNLKLCIFNFIFNTNGQINNNILKDFNRNQLSTELNKRFKMAAIINLILSPFLVIYFILLYFFSNFNDYRLNPSYLINLRQFTPFAEWKLREFNELPHFFNKRIKLSFGPSNNYINQFPSNFLIVNLTYLINFFTGSILAILIIFGLILDDEDHNFWSFELTDNKSTLFYISIIGTIFAITSNSSNDINNASTIGSSSIGGNPNDLKSYYYDPEASIKYVSQFTHYLPSHWKGKLHTTEVKNEYCQLFNLKIIIIFNEILSIILTPFLLWFKISNSSSLIIDFFRDYSIHIDGLGYICYFSMFNFEQKDKNMMANGRKKNKKHERRNSDDSDDFYQQDDKMIKSYMYFLESYQPEQSKPINRNNNGNTTINANHNHQSQFNHLSNNKINNNPLDSPDASNFINSYQLDIDDDEEEIKLGKSGVLGMLNQFYRQDLNKN